jgi:hypothetical protein
MSASLMTWACLSCGEEGTGDMPPEHGEHQAPGPRELIVIVHPSTGWGVTMCPIELLSPMQRERIWFQRTGTRAGWWCAPLP